jgi:hypothetical protein
MGTKPEKINQNIGMDRRITLTFIICMLHNCPADPCRLFMKLFTI